MTEEIRTVQSVTLKNWEEWYLYLETTPALRGLPRAGFRQLQYMSLESPWISINQLINANWYPHMQHNVDIQVYWMAVRKALILTTFLYFLLFVGGAIVSITIGIVQGQLDGGCLLYASGSWSYSGCREGFRACFHVVWTKVHGPCSFVTTMGAVTCLFGFGMFVYCTYTLFARSRRE